MLGGGRTGLFCVKMSSIRKYFFLFWEMRSAQMKADLVMACTPQLLMETHVCMKHLAVETVGKQWWKGLSGPWKCLCISNDPGEPLICTRCPISRSLLHKPNINIKAARGMLIISVDGAIAADLCKKLMRKRIGSMSL